MLPVYRISKKHFYPRPPRGGRPQAEGAGGTRPTISIHALREEGDRDFFFFGGFLGYFYPRPPRGGRPRRSTYAATGEGFLSTPSARRATESREG